MSATAARAIRLLPHTQSLPLVTSRYSLSLRHSQKPPWPPVVCLRHPQMIQRIRFYATENGNDDKKDEKNYSDQSTKKEKDEKKDSVPTEKPSSEPKKSEDPNAAFRNFFDQHGEQGEQANRNVNNEKNNEGGKHPQQPDGNPPKETTAQRIERMVRESRAKMQKGQGPYPFEEKESRQDQSQSQEPDQNPNNQQDPQSNDPNKPKGPPPPKAPVDHVFTFNNIWLSLSLTYILYRLVDSAGESREITWQEFRTAFLDKGLVDKLNVVNNKIVRVALHSNATGQMYPQGETPPTNRASRYYFSIGSVEAFERKLDEAQNELGIPTKDRIPVAYSSEVSYSGIFTSMLPLVIVIGTITWLSRRMGAMGTGRGRGSLFDFASSKAKMFNVDQKINVTFKDVAGLDEAKEEIVEFVKFLKEPQTYERLGAKIPRGAILSGPPGTGKTLLAKATAGEAGVPFLSVSGSEFVEMFVGVGAARVRDLFAQARKNQPSIIFIDEIDAIGKARDRGKFRVGNDEREQTLNQILVEMDGFGTTEHVVVLAGTNRVDTLDPALMRPGRFDRHIAIDGPDLSGRKQIFDVHLRKLKLADPADELAERLSVLTAGFTGADIANACNEAALIAARYKADAVALKHFEQAIERVTAGLEKKSRVLSPEDKNQVAYHEAGHAVAGWNLEWVDPLLKVSIVPRARALGYASYLPKDEYMTSKRKVLDRMVMALAGRVSEEIFFGDDAVGSGASDDFRKVTSWATTYVTTWGMSKRVGPVYYASNPDELQKPFSEETARIIDEEVKKIIMEAYERTHALLTEHKESVVKLAKQLMEFEVLTYRDVEHLIGPRKYPTKGLDLSKILGEESGFGRLVPKPASPEDNPLAENPIAAATPLDKSHDGESKAL